VDFTDETTDTLTDEEIGRRYVRRRFGKHKAQQRQRTRRTVLAATPPGLSMPSPAQSPATAPGRPSAESSVPVQSERPTPAEMYEDTAVKEVTEDATEQPPDPEENTVEGCAAMGYELLGVEAVLGAAAKIQKKRSKKKRAKLAKVASAAAIQKVAAATALDAGDLAKGVAAVAAAKGGDLKTAANILKTEAAARSGDPNAREAVDVLRASAAIHKKALETVDRLTGAPVGHYAKGMEMVPAAPAPSWRDFYRRSSGPER
jgi:hypothetical protein